jgi:hypothetical protein
MLLMLQDLLDWHREHTSPLDPNGPHELIAKAKAALYSYVSALADATANATRAS